MILSLDPSSTVIGWALLREPQDLIEAGLIRPNDPKTTPIHRIRSMAADVRELLTTFVPDEILVETTSGKVGLNRHSGRGAGLAVYGMAVGAIWHACESWAAPDLFGVGPKPRVHPVEENRWTRGQAKWKRIAAVAGEFSQYDPSTDPGGDMADAIGLACWFIREQAVCVRRAAS
jgi:hypothetical protein